MNKIFLCLMGELSFAARSLLEFRKNPWASRGSLPLGVPPSLKKRALIWIGFYIAGCGLIGLFAGMAWGIITPVIAGWLS